MKFRPITALLLCASLISPSAAQTRVATGVASVPAGVRVVPMLGVMTSPLASTFGNGTLLAPSMAPALSGAPSPAVSAAGPVPVLPAAAVLSVKAAAIKTTQPLALKSAAGSAPVRDASEASAALSMRAEGETFWSGAAAKGDDGAAAPAGPPTVTSVLPVSRGISVAGGGTGDVNSAVPPAERPIAPGTPPIKKSWALRLAGAGAVLVPAIAAFPHLPAWLSDVAPYAGGAAAMVGAYTLTRVSRWAIDKLAPRLGWGKNGVVMARFISSVALWTAGAGVGLSMLGVSGKALLATFGAGGTATALAITLAVRDVAGNLFHGVHFLLSRPYTIGDKVTIGKTTGVVHDLTLRYLVLRSETGGFLLYTHNIVAASAVKLYGEYKTKELRLSLRKPVFPRGLFRAMLDAATPTLWKPILLSALAIAALSFFPMLPIVVKGTSVSWLAGVLPFLKAGVIGVLVSALVRSLKTGVERLGSRYGWTRPAMTVAKLGVTVLTWLIGGSFLLSAVGVSWTWVAATLSLSTVLVIIAVNDYINAAFQGALVLGLKPFEIGDRVKIGEHEGSVVDITMQYVVLKLDDESFMLIPHSVVKDSGILTPREYGQRRK